MAYVLRQVQAGEDYPRLAALESLWDYAPVSGDELRHMETSQPEGTLFQRIVAIDDAGWIVGTAKAGHQHWEQEGRFFVMVIVDPMVRNQGIGSYLYETALGFIDQHRASSVESIVGEDNPAARRFAETRGFSVTRHLYPSTLDVRTFDATPFAGTIESLEDAGIRFFTWADLEGTADQKRMLYQLYIAAEQDVPADDPYHPPPPEQFQKDILESPAFLPQGLIIAANGDQWVGVTQVLSGDREVVYHGFTGVVRGHRGRNIAVALKLLSIGACQRLQVKQVKTSNDSQNLPMLAINRKLGCTSEPGAYVVRKEL
ncbi:MAG: GNAT family N-acetyltransferase [Chloroflexota bacterium]